MKPVKTNALRLLEKSGIPFTQYTYESDGAVDGVTVAGKIGVEPALVYKTLVTRGKTGQHYVFVVPVERELNLKAAAQAAGEKSVELVAVKELLGLTGYVRGGCSPVGMKKPYPTVIDQTARSLSEIIVSGGRIGLQVRLDPRALCQYIGGKFAGVAL